MADHIEDALIREVNDDLREEQMKQLWKRFGGYVVGVAVLIVAIVAGYQGWKQYDVSTRGAEGEGFHAAQQRARAGDMDGALQAFAQLSLDASSGYGVLAEFQHAAIMAVKGDAAGASQLYQKIARDNSGDVALSGLATVQAAMVDIDAGGYDAGAMTVRLNAIAGDDHPYRYSARELLGLIAMDSGETAQALDLYKQLAADAKAPAGIRNRATKLVQYLGG